MTRKKRTLRGASRSVQRSNNPSDEAGLHDHIGVCPPKPPATTPPVVRKAVALGRVRRAFAVFGARRIVPAASVRPRDLWTLLDLLDKLTANPDGPTLSPAARRFTAAAGGGAE